MTEPDAWLLVEYQEGYSITEGPISTWTLEDDYYNPVIVCKTRAELVDFLHSNIHTTIWNGDTATVHKVNWNGDPKGQMIYHAIPIQFGKIIVY